MLLFPQYFVTFVILFIISIDITGNNIDLYILEKDERLDYTHNLTEQGCQYFW